MGSPRSNGSAILYPVRDGFFEWGKWYVGAQALGKKMLRGVRRRRLKIHELNENCRARRLGAVCQLAVRREAVAEIEKGREYGTE